LADQGELPIRVYGLLSATPDLLATLPKLIHNVDRNGDQMFIVRGVKVFADGALGSRGAALSLPYSDDPQNRGLWVTRPDELRSIAETVAEAGWQMATHAIGDAANHAVLDAYQAALEKRRGNDLRFRVEHAQVLPPEDIGRFGQLKVIASMQPTHATSDMGWAVARLGERRAKYAYAWRQILNNGGRLAFGSDFPVEQVSPLLGLYAAVTRQDAAGRPPGGFFPAERLTLEEAIRAFTLEGAYASFVDPFRGAIRPGAIADLTVYDRKLEGNASLLSTRIRMTVVNGEIQFERE
jgi:predicted amidohydrolase YtcJ